MVMNHRAWSTCAATPEYLQNYSATRVQTGDIERFFADALRETSALTTAQYEVLVALARCARWPLRHRQHLRPHDAGLPLVPQP